jgi:hypothetical protein
MSTIKKIRTAFRKVPLLGWFAAGLLLLSGILLLAWGLKSDPTVTGIIRLDGQPLSKGSVRFVPAKGTHGSDGGRRFGRRGITGSRKV